MKIFNLILFVSLSFSAASQPIFQKINFNEALSNSQKTGKLILLQLDALDCEMCNYVAAEAFTDPGLSKKIKEDFIAIKIDSKHTDRNLINGLLDLNDKNFGTYFIDGSKDLIHRYDQTTSLVKTYYDQLDSALVKKSEANNLNVIENKYKQFKNNDLLEQWIWERNKLNLNNDSLLNIYADNLSLDSMNSSRVLNFIAMQSPILNCKADIIFRSNGQFRKIWYGIPVDERIKINSKIISKSLQKAIKEKNENYAIRVADFTRGTYTDPEKGQVYYGRQLMKYFEGVKNMDKYMAYATVYFDNYFLKTTPQDVFLKDSLKRVVFLNEAKVNTTKANDDKTSSVVSFQFAPGGQSYTNTLNQAAWFIYQNTDEKKYLIKALEWSTIGNQYYENFEALDTEARIRYRLEERSEAIALMEKAVRLKNERTKIPTAFSNLNIVLQNMKQNKNIIDPE